MKFEHYLYSVVMGFNLLEENRNGKKTRKAVFIVTFKLIFCC